MSTSTTTPGTPQAPVGSWGPDILGPGFQARTLPLLPDEEDDNYQDRKSVV